MTAFVVVLLWLGAMMFTAPEAAAQFETDAGSPEAGRVHVEVVATGPDGKVLDDLRREDFRVFLQNRQVPIESFSRFALPDLGQSIEAAATDRVQPESDARRPLLVVAYDARARRPTLGRQRLEELGQGLESLLASTRAIMIVRLGPKLEIAQPFTRDPVLLRAALARWVDPVRPGGGAATGELEDRADSKPPEAPPTTDASRFEAARAELEEIRELSELQEREQREVLSQLETLTALLGGLPGRKGILYLGPQRRPRPAQELFRGWRSRHGSAVSDPRLGLLESALEGESPGVELDALLEKARRARVTFYGHPPGGRGRPAESGAADSTQMLASDARNTESWVRALARSTGGVQDVRVASLVAEMTTAFGSFYSLGCLPVAESSQTGAVRVELIGREGRLRYSNRYAMVGQRDLEDLTEAVLVTELAFNPMELRLEMEEPALQQDGTYLVPLQVEIPIASLSLVPEGARHVGKLSVVVQAQSAAGELSAPVEAEVPVEIANDVLLTALDGLAGYRLSLRLSKGEQRVVVGVRDEVAKRDSVVGAVFRARTGS